MRVVGRAIAAALLVVSVMGVVDTPPAPGVQAASCADEAEWVTVDGTSICVHHDEAPPGVDVTEHVPTSELLDREGVGPRVQEAAEALGLPTTPASTATSPDVTCDGDGTSGYRVQPMYVVEAGRTNRFTQLRDSMRVWAAGTDDVVNRSAALTGGVRHLRYVTAPGGGGCVADVLNVTVPAGSLASFGSTITAVQALGYTSAARKYLMWTDATSLCGVATMYTSDTDSQSNPNNGSYPQYARIDSGCWGLGDGSGQHSVEAHEVLHTLGGVQSTAPHGTRAGHCWDESDTMCYADGGGFAMQQICPTSAEFFLDCRHDDYFSTFPDPGSYLDLHWNSADSRFLVGGGNGTGGGAAGSPTTLGATIAVNNPAVPGLMTQVSVTPALPDGRTLTSVKWKASRADCSFDAPDAVQASVTCGAASAAAATVTATLVDSTGATRSVSSPLTFVTGTARPVTITLSAASQSSGPASVCTAATFPVVATVVDTASGQPVKGLSVAFTRTTAALTAPASAGSAVTTVAGAATVSPSISVATDYVATTVATAVYAAGAPASRTTVPERCSASLTAAATATDVYYADLVTLSGRLTRTVAGTVVPVPSAPLTARLQSVTAGVTTLTTLTTLATVTTGADGRWSVVVRPTRTGTLSVVLPASTSYVGSTATAGAVTVRIPTTTLGASVDRTDVGYGGTVTVAGRLQRVAGAATTALSGSTVSVLVTAPGKAPVTVASGRTSTTGAFTVPVPLKLTGTMSVTYAGAAGQPATAVSVGGVVAGTFQTAVTLASGAASAPVGGAVTLSGAVTRTYRGSTEGARGIRVQVWFRPGGTGTAVLVTSTTTSTTLTTGAWSARVSAKSTGTYTAVVSGVAGHQDSSSAAVGLTVS